jgi:hypothetical protein
MLSVILQNVIMLIIILPNVTLLRVTLLNVIFNSIILLYVILIFSHERHRDKGRGNLLRSVILK